MIYCPYGGNCIDPGNPSDCEANNGCVNFKSVEQRAEFDALPDRYFFRYAAGGVLKFKNENQLQFFLTDLRQELKEGAEWGML